MSLKTSRNDLDFCRAKFSNEVGEEMKYETRFADGKLSERKVATFRYDGYKVQEYLFSPDNVTYGRNYTHITFEDLQKSLDDGIIDTQKTEITLHEAYQNVFDKVDNDLIDTLVFNLSEEQQKALVGGGAVFPGTPDNEGSPFAGISQLRGLEGRARRLAFHNVVSEIEQSENYKLLDSFFAIDFNKISPLKAILRLNKLFGLKTWISRSGSLHVGTPETSNIKHLAAPDDKRVWRLKDPQISHGREPIKTVIVQGAWQDEAGVPGPRDIVEWFSNNDGSGVGDAVAYGYASRTDIQYGQTITIKNTKAKKDALPKIARSKLREKMKQQQTGTVEIDTRISGEEVSKLERVRPGDFIHLVPDDVHFDFTYAGSGSIGAGEQTETECSSMVDNDIYLITEVEHNQQDSGHWSIFLDIVMYPTAPIGSQLIYFDPETGEIVDEEEFTSGFIEGRDDTGNDFLDAAVDGIGQF
jgi:hypothetical protein